ncbi:MAG: peptidylprolyl isomerase [Leptotrichiaceae bacterium]|jgi:peptidyl-prolyl cis-trans isomerase B (cyclophilin B)|nr:peptidylprolyl isomerase [Leptotrichiaceae bacterium]
MKQQKIEDKKQKDFVKKMASYELEATISTTKGDINIYLYPEAAPVTVASFVKLSKEGFYNGLKFHRVIANVLAQGGDPNGDGTGSAGYTIKDEIAKWVDFTDPGMLAMANSGPNTNGSQFFLTMNTLTQLNGQYTIFGELKSREDLSILKLIRQGDKIISIQIKGRKVDEFLGNFTDIINSWNR